MIEMGDGAGFAVFSVQFSVNRRSTGPLIRPPATFSPEGEKGGGCGKICGREFGVGSLRGLDFSAIHVDPIK